MRGLNPTKNDVITGLSWHKGVLHTGDIRSSNICANMTNTMGHLLKTIPMTHMDHSHIEVTDYKAFEARYDVQRRFLPDINKKVGP